jgi:hypothetical protein
VDPIDLVGWSATHKLDGHDVTITVVRYVGQMPTMVGMQPKFEVSYSDGRKNAEFSAQGLISIIGVKKGHGHVG